MTAIIVLFLLFAVVSSGGDMRSQADKLYSDANYREAMELYLKLLNTEENGNDLGKIMTGAAHCMAKLGDCTGWDEVREKVLANRDADWRMVLEVNEQYYFMPSYGSMVDGVFKRGDRSGNWNNHRLTAQMDRVRILQLLQAAMQNIEKDAGATPEDKIRFYAAFERRLMPEGAQSWRLQLLSDLTVLPEPEQDYPEGSDGAPVLPDGTPVLYKLPESWETAASDGERWRWILKCLSENGEKSAYQADRILADFLHREFGMNRLYYGLFRGKSNILEVLSIGTLKDDEFIVKLATGIAKITLPDEFNYIAIYKRLYERHKAYEADISAVLAEIYTERMQYEMAAEWWRKCGDSKRAQQKLKDIEGWWGTFERGQTQLAGREAYAELRFRNAKAANFVVYNLNMEAFIKDMENALAGRTSSKGRYRPNDYYALRNEKYQGAKLHEWTVSLEPAKGHLDKVVKVPVKVSKPGVYVVECTFPGGNVCRIPLVLEAMKIVSATCAGKGMWQVLDAENGKPLENVELQLFGYAAWWSDLLKKHRTSIRRLNGKTDKNGMFILPSDELQDEKGNIYQWNLIASSENYGKAWFGFTSYYSGGHYPEHFENIRTFGVVDRPVYRPGDTMHSKVWMTDAGYGDKENSAAGRKNTGITIYAPTGTQILRKNCTLDEYGGAELDWLIPEDAALGRYRIEMNRAGSHYCVSFLVEEYRKPEYRVTVELPGKPLTLGEKTEAVVRAEYFFGAPVTDAAVEVTVTRRDYASSWWPARPWDWFYGPGYWWCKEERPWLRNWNEWGRIFPEPGRYSPAPVETVAVLKGRLQEDGTFKIPLDTSMTAKLYGDRDHKYEITAQVRDKSRRTIVGNGTVLATRRPFEVFVWQDRGYYTRGDRITVKCRARSFDAKPVTGTAVFKLYRIKYDTGKEPEEILLDEVPLNPDPAGCAAHDMKLAEGGQYRAVWQVKDEGGREVSGATVIFVRGGELKASNYRFNDLELVTDKPEYAPGDKVRLAINTEREDASVMIFMRPLNGKREIPEVFTVHGKSSILEIDVKPEDMPNFFIEAYTVSNGQVYYVTREIFVPPSGKVLNVEVEVLDQKVEPGTNATAVIKVTGMDGKPAAGNLTVAVYDKSLEYIAGSEIRDIRESFWGWRRHSWKNLQFMHWNLDCYLREGEKPMPVLGYLSRFFTSYGVDASSTAVNGRSREIKLMKAEVAVLESAPAPQAAMAPKTDAAADSDSGAGTSVTPLTVRKNFADTALWLVNLNTDKDGKAEISIPLPDSLTSWKISAWCLGKGSSAGSGSGELAASKNLMVRLQAPRFFVEKDEVVVSAVVNNYHPETVSAAVSLELDGGVLEIIDGVEKTVQVDSGKDVRVDWILKALMPGTAVIRVLAVSPAGNDGMELSFPVLVHGMEKLEARSGTIRRDDNEARLVLDVPEKIRPGSQLLELRWSPSLAMSMLDAVPYLIDYPYGCTEQTLNRFVPAVLAGKALEKTGISLDEIAGFKNNLDAQELGNPEERKKQRQRPGTAGTFSQAELEKIIRKGLLDLNAMQLSDGGWGWFSGWGEHSSPHITAQVVHGLLSVKKQGLDVPAAMLDRGVRWLKIHQNGRLAELKKHENSLAGNMDAFVFQVLGEAGAFNAEMGDRLLKDKEHLSLLGKSLLALAFHNEGNTVERDRLMRNIYQFISVDMENQTAFLNTGSSWWCWYDDVVETQANYLRLLSAVDPAGELAPMLVKYLLNNRKHGTYWRSTRDTAAVLETFADYIKATEEDEPDMTVEIILDGVKIADSGITRENMFTENMSFQFDSGKLNPGRHEILLHRQGKGPVYFNCYLKYFSLEDNITGTGLELKVNRRIYKLTSAVETKAAPDSSGLATGKNIQRFTRTELLPGTAVDSGDLLEVELTVESKNDYEYILLEDMKAAGTEPVDLRSGYTGNSLGAYVEFRDTKVSMFIQHLPRGKRSVSYRLRAEAPGTFSALPAVVYGMYAPELKGNSNEIKVKIQDAH